MSRRLAHLSDAGDSTRRPATRCLAAAPHRAALRSTARPAARRCRRRGGAARPCTVIASAPGSALSVTLRTKRSFEPSKKLSHSCPAYSRRFTLSATAVARRRERVVVRPGTQVAPVWQCRAAARTTGSCSVEPSGFLATASGRFVPHSSSRWRSRPRSGLRPPRRKLRGRVRRYLCSQRPPAATSSTGPCASAYGFDARFRGRVPSAATGSAVIM